MRRTYGLLLSGILLVFLTLLAGCTTTGTPIPSMLSLFDGNVSQPIILPEGVAYTISLPFILTPTDALRIEAFMRMQGYVITGRLDSLNETIITAYDPARTEQMTLRYQYGTRTVHVLLTKN